MSDRIAAIFALVRRREDGWFSLTDLAAATGKRVSEYVQNKGVIYILERLSARTGLPAQHILDVRKGGVPADQGTWAHPQLAMHFAYWACESLQLDFTAWLVDRLLLEMQCDDTINGAVPDAVDQECDDGDRPATSIPTAAECMALSDCG